MRANQRWWACAGAMLATGLASVVIGAPVVGSAPFKMPQTGALPTDIWTGGKAPRTATRVKVTDGKVRLEVTTKALDPEEPDSVVFWPVSAGIDCVYEGAYDLVRLLPRDDDPDPTAEGLWELRAPVEPGTADHTVGFGEATLEAASTVAVYRGQTRARRLVAFRATGGPVEITEARSALSPTLVAIDAGDWSVVCRHEDPLKTESLFVRAVSPTSVGFHIYDIDAPYGPVVGTASGPAGDTDALGVDGLCGIIVRLKNTGSIPLEVTWKQTADPAAQVTTIPPGQAQPLVGALSLLQWTYSDPAATGASGAVLITVSSP